MAKKLRITAVGCGGVGLRHQKGHLACPETELVAVCDMDIEKAEQSHANKADGGRIRMFFSIQYSHR